MNTTILALLRADATAWRYHDTPAKIRRSVLENLASVRQILAMPGAYISCGRGGTVIHGVNVTISSYGPFEAWGKAQALHLLGLPFVDTRTIPDQTIHKIVSLPMYIPGEEPEADLSDYHGFSYVSFDTYLTLAQNLGATYHAA